MVEIPVEKIIEKEVQVPVERIVYKDKIVEVSSHLISWHSAAFAQPRAPVSCV